MNTDNRSGAAQPAHESHADFIAETRSELEQHERINCWFRPEFVRTLIDRLEAAHKREMSKNASKNGADFGQLGDAAKRNLEGGAK